MKPKEKEIISVLENEVKPLLQLHLGSLDFVSFKDGVVAVRLEGNCKGCPLSELTLKAGIESVLKEKFKDVTSVIAVE
ncbi:NifU family protein [Candidatus Giovannonibacteria bacterium]|nr:NifU family protein [Candidatus Giovannonibacteria bacterium]